MPFKDILDKFIRSRAGYKSRVTVVLKEIKEKQDKGELTKDLLNRHQSLIQEWLDKISKVNDQIDKDCDDQCIDVTDVQRQDDLNAEVKYLTKVQTDLYEFACKCPSTPVSSPDALASAITKLQSAPLKPKLQCSTFSGVDVDKLAFKDFLTQFQNCVDAGGSMSNSVKLTYLRGYLTGYAYKIISHLSITDDNYLIAIKLLKDEFLDTEYIVDEYLKQLIHNYPKFDSTFANVRQYLNETRAALHELKTYGVDLMEDGSAGAKLISHIIFDKLPNILKKELISKVNCNFPTIVQIFDNYNDLLKTLSRTKYKYKFQVEDKKSTAAKSEWKPKKTAEGKSASLENFATSNSGSGYGQVKFCKFCSVKGHSMYNCDTYDNPEARRLRCRELKMCFLCSSVKHLSDKCLGKQNKLSFECCICKSKGHISALCSKFEKVTKTQKVDPSVTGVNVCLNTGVLEHSYMLPVMDIFVSRGHSRVKVTCLIDFGSQRSYFSHTVLNDLHCDISSLSPIEYDIKTYLGHQFKTLGLTSFEISMQPNSRFTLPVLVDQGFDINLNIPGLSTVLSNLKKLDFKLASEYVGCSDTIKVQGLLGVDILQFVDTFSKINCMNGAAIKFPFGIAPFGDLRHFMYSDQVKQMSSALTCNNYNSIITHHACCPTTYVNFVLEPKHSYFDPLSQVFEESLVEQNIDKMFSLESIGIADTESFSNYDKIKCQEFENSIEYKDNCYHVKLPWHEDKVREVPSNYDVALSVLNRVVKKLEQQNLLSEYLEVFKQQEKEGIIERFEVSPDDFGDYVWIPHRPIIKTELQVTTKIRPVFNCSLKVQGKPSLNEAAYAGINLMGDLFNLLLLFRSNKYVMLADIRKAFLMIKLADDTDRNRFCFFMKEEDKLICYRYNTIIFGFNASPFILNFVIKHHANKFPNDLCTSIMKSNFYVDNLIYTGNSPTLLSQLYKESYNRMLLGGFTLRSWNTNCFELKEQMISDENYVDHGCDLEKVLGYRFSTERDSIQLSPSRFDQNVITKRSILSNISKVFDPMGLCLPVTVRGRLIMRDLWTKKLDWDDEIPSEFQSSWSSLHSDLSQLCSLQFSRCAIYDNMPSELYIFCDASKKVYGFTAYSVQAGKSNLIYAKAKVAPMKPKSLPTLELLSVYLCTICLSSLLESYCNVKFSNIVIAVDAQVVLSWLLSDEIKSKNQFVKNRLKDIQRILTELKDKFSVDINFKYVPSASNPADLITRGLTFDKFREDIETWNSGPAWLTSPESWPVSDLNCLSKENKRVILSNVTFNDSDSELRQVGPVVPFKQFSDLRMLIAVTAIAFKLRNRIKKVNEDPNLCAVQHLIKAMQFESFPEELSYLHNPTGKRVPELVKHLNLFVDTEGIIRSEGRIGKSTMYEYEVLKPILLGKDHYLTELIIMDCHKRCKHLGIQTTLNKVRISGFWVPKARQMVKKVLSQCIACQKINNLTFKYPKVTNLPKHRVNLVKPFMHTGIDYTGHVWVKGENGNNYKMFLLIFTCLSIRAIHIEVVPDMSTHSFVLALLRFTNIYGIPSHIYSDNARSFIAGCNLVEDVVSSNEYNEHFRVHNIKHITIPLYSAWVGSTWERLIRVVKSCLYKTVGRSRIKYFDLLTHISDIQNAINSRPLTYRCSDSNLEVITPNCFIRPNANEGIMLRMDDRDICKSDPPSRLNVIKSIELRDTLLSKFKELWYDSYLLSLREQCKALHEVNYVNKIKVDDVVLVKIPNKSRPFWPLGRVIELVEGDDGKVRSVRLKRGDGAIQHHSIKHLYPLELTLTHAYQPQIPVDESDQSAFRAEALDDIATEVRAEALDDGSRIEAEALEFSNVCNETSFSDKAQDVNVSSNQKSVRPKRLAVQRGRQRPADDPYIYY